MHAVVDLLTWNSMRCASNDAHSIELYVHSIFNLCATSCEQAQMALCEPPLRVGIAGVYTKWEWLH
jgi:hypothetical protein